MVQFSHSIEQRKQFNNCEVNDLDVVWYCFTSYRHLQKNRLHGKAAEPCLANS